MLKLENVTKYYGDFKAVENISLTINNGEIFGFIGKNGAGKSTTIKACVGIHDYQGSISYDGIDLKKNPVACKKMLAYVPDTPNMYNSMTGIAYLNFIADIFSVGKERKERIESLSTKLEIRDALNDVISSYSHGMQQKLAIVAALLHNPKVLILDEPFVGLDPEAIFHLKELMKEFCANGGAILFSSHVLEIVERLCDRIAIIHKGKVVRMGTVEEVCHDKELEEIFMSMEKEG